MLDAAARVFYERGYSDASVQDVADELGILKGSLYHYIDTKEDLLFRLLQETHDEIYEILEEVAALEGLNPIERLEIYIRRQVEYNIDNLLRVSVYYHDLERLTEERRKAIVGRRREHETWVIGLIRRRSPRARRPGARPEDRRALHLRHDHLDLPLVPQGARRRARRSRRPARRSRCAASSATLIYQSTGRNLRRSGRTARASARDSDN